MGQSRGPLPKDDGLGASPLERGFGGQIKAREAGEEEMWLRTGHAMDAPEHDIGDELERTRDARRRESGDWRNGEPAYKIPGGRRWSNMYYPVSRHASEDEDEKMHDNIGQLDENQGISHSRENTRTATRRHGPRNLDDLPPLTVGPALNPPVVPFMAPPERLITPPLTPQADADKDLVDGDHYHPPIMLTLHAAELHNHVDQPGDSSSPAQTDSFFGRVFQRSIERESLDGPLEHASPVPDALSPISHVASFHAPVEMMPPANQFNNLQPTDSPPSHLVNPWPETASQVPLVPGERAPFYRVIPPRLSPNPRPRGLTPSPSANFAVLPPAPSPILPTRNISITGKLSYI